MTGAGHKVAHLESFPATLLPESGRVHVEMSSSLPCSTKEVDAVCTDANKVLAIRLLNGRVNHLTRA